MSSTPEDLRVVYESLYFGDCNDRALVLTAANIPHQIVRDTTGCALVVPAEQSAAAIRELELYDDENPPVVPKPAPTVPHFDPLPGAIGYFLIICAVAWMAGNGIFGEDWRAAGRIDGNLIRDGQWWRLITALTLHADVAHLVGNLLFGTVFGLFAGRLLGSGVAWFATVTAAGLGNLLNTLLLESAHRAIGASTAVFAALGLVAGYAWRARLLPQERWAYRIGPIVGGFALLMYTGAGGEDGDTDVGAHLFGFLSGLAFGIAMTLAVRLFESRRVQLVSGVAAVTLVVIAWTAAFISERANAIM